MARTRAKVMMRRESGTFFRVPTSVLLSAAYRSLPMRAKALLLDLGAQFTGFNNGHQSASFRLMKPQGWTSKQTLQAALQDLLEKGLIELTRQGGRNRCSLVGFTWMPIDAGSVTVALDVPTTRVASGLWRQCSEAMASDVAKENASASPTVGALCPGDRGNDRRSAA